MKAYISGKVMEFGTHRVTAESIRCKALLLTDTPPETKDCFGQVMIYLPKENCPNGKVAAGETIFDLLECSDFVLQPVYPSEDIQL